MKIDDYLQGIETAVLPNGLRVYFLHRPVGWVKARIMVHAGPLHEQKGKTGLAHFLEHALVAGSPISYKRLRSIFSKSGGSVTVGETSRAAILYKLWVASPRKGALRSAFNHISSLLFDSDIQKGFEKERQTVLNEYDSQTSFQALDERVLKKNRVLYAGHERMEQWVGQLGFRKDVEALTAGDLEAFYSRYFIPNNMSIMIVGGISFSEAVQSVKDSSLGSLPKGNTPPSLSPYILTDSIAMHSDIVRVSDFTNLESSCSGYGASWTLPPSHELSDQVEYIAENMLYEMLMDTLRFNEQKVYDLDLAQTDFISLRNYSLNIQCSHEFISHIDGIVQSTILKLPESKRLFTVLKRRLISRFAVADKNVENILERCDTDLEYQGRVVSVTEYVRALEDVTMDDVFRFSELLSDKRKYVQLTIP